MPFLKKWKNFYKLKQPCNVEAIIKNTNKDINSHIESLQEKKNIFLLKFILQSQTLLNLLTL